MLGLTAVDISTPEGFVTALAVVIEAVGECRGNGDLGGTARLLAWARTAYTTNNIPCTVTHSDTAV